MTKEQEYSTIACGSLKAMEMIKQKGFRGLNTKTHRYQIIDKDAKYEIKQEGNLFFLMSDKDLVEIAERKGLII